MSLRPGRLAIDFLKDYYREGGAPLPGREFIRALIIAELGFSEYQVTPSQAAEWDRVARQELYREIGSPPVTQPVAQQDYERNAAAPWWKINQGDISRAKTVMTYIRHQREVAENRSRQPNSTAVHQRFARRWRIVEELMEELIFTAGNPAEVAPREDIVIDVR